MIPYHSPNILQQEEITRHDLFIKYAKVTVELNLKKCTSVWFVSLCRFLRVVFTIRALESDRSTCAIVEENAMLHK